MLTILDWTARIIGYLVLVGLLAAVGFVIAHIPKVRLAINYVKNIFHYFPNKRRIRKGYFDEVIDEMIDLMPDVKVEPFRGSLRKELIKRKEEINGKSSFEGI